MGLSTSGSGLWVIMVALVAQLVVLVACELGKLSSLGVVTLTSIAGLLGRWRRTIRLMMTDRACEPKAERAAHPHCFRWLGKERAHTPERASQPRECSPKWEGPCAAFTVHG